MTRLLRLLVLAALATTLPARAPAQNADCDYRHCALGISPRWNGLAVIGGASEADVATLHFFWPRDISAQVAGNMSAPGADSALAAAKSAVRLRRAGAAFTDVGVLVAAAGVVSALSSRHVSAMQGALIGAGVASISISVPLQFAADGALSRAVWWHNRRFAR